MMQKEIAVRSLATSLVSAAPKMEYRLFAAGPSSCPLGWRAILGGCQSGRRSRDRQNEEFGARGSSPP